MITPGSRGGSRTRRNTPATNGVAILARVGAARSDPRCVGRSSVAAGRRAGLFVRSGVGRAVTEGGICRGASLRRQGCEAPASQGNSGCKWVATQATAAFQRQHVDDALRAARLSVLSEWSPQRNSDHHRAQACPGPSGIHLTARMESHAQHRFWLTPIRNRTRSRSPFSPCP
jgi:hypothetical protein